MLQIEQPTLFHLTWTPFDISKPESLVGLVGPQHWVLLLILISIIPFHHRPLSVWIPYLLSSQLYKDRLYTSISSQDYLHFNRFWKQKELLLCEQPLPFPREKPLDNLGCSDRMAGTAQRGCPMSCGSSDPGSCDPGQGCQCWYVWCIIGNIGSAELTAGLGDIGGLSSLTDSGILWLYVCNGSLTHQWEYYRQMKAGVVVFHEIPLPYDELPLDTHKPPHRLFWGHFKPSNVQNNQSWSLWFFQWGKNWFKTLKPNPQVFCNTEEIPESLPELESSV